MKKKVHFIKVALQENNHFIIDSPDIWVVYAHNYSGDITVEVTAEGAVVYIYGIYIGKKASTFQLNTVQHHRVGNTISDLLVKGVFYDDSKFIYQGLIRIDKNAQKSNAYQKNQNLLMSDKAFVDSRPFLEILANDVRCTHGSTTGTLDNEDLFYLASRGLSKKSAEKALIEGFIQDVMIRLKSLVPGASLPKSAFL